MRKPGGRLRSWVVASAGVLLLVLAFVCWRVSLNRSPAQASATPALGSKQTAALKVSQAGMPESDGHAGSKTALTRRAPVARTGINAADFYKDAFVLFEQLTPEEKKILAHPTDEVDESVAKALFAKIQPIMDKLREAAAKAAYCDWGTGPMRLDTAVPEITASLRLGQLARWEAAVRFDEDAPGALADLQAETRLAANVGDTAMVGFLVKTSLDKGVLTLISQRAGEFSPEELTIAGRIAQSLAPDEALARAMERESELVRNYAAVLSDPKTSSQIWDSLEQLPPEAGGVQGLGRSREELLANLPAQVEWLEKIQRQVAQKAMLPDSEFKAWWAEVMSQRNNYPIASLALPAVEGIRNSMQISRVNQALLTAGLNILQGGVAQKGAVMDPSTGRPFTYVASSDGGFELRSNLTSKGKPITMRFGREQ